MNLSRRVRDLRYAKGWGPDELASRAKISRTALYQIERGSTQQTSSRHFETDFSSPWCSSRGLAYIVRLMRTRVADRCSVSNVPNDDASAQVPFAVDYPSSERAEELIEKFRLLLSSPLAEGVARIVEESFRLLPIIPPPSSVEPSRHVSRIEIEPARHVSRRRSSSDDLSVCLKAQRKNSIDLHCRIGCRSPTG